MVPRNPVIESNFYKKFDSMRSAAHTGRRWVSFRFRYAELSKCS